MPPKFKDKGKAPQQKQESPKPSNPLRLLSSSISSAKPIKSWIDMVTEEEEKSHSSQVQTWVDSYLNFSRITFGSTNYKIKILLER
jgi:hypothetical protein